MSTWTWATPLADADAGFVERTLRRAVATLADAPTAPSLRIRSDEGDVWSIGDGATSVTGSRAGPAAVDRPGPRGRGDGRGAATEPAGLGLTR